MKVVGSFFRLVASLLLLTVPVAAQYRANINIPANDINHPLVAWDGHQLTTLVGPPANGSCLTWQIWYFKPGEAKIPGKQWGLDDGNSPEAVLKRQKSSEQFDHTYARFAGIPYPPDSFVHDNYTGPVCVTKQSMLAGPNLSELDKANDLIGKAQDLFELGQKLAEKVPYSDYSAVSQMRQYLSAVHDTLDHVMQLKRMLLQTQGPALSQIESGLTQASTRVSQEEQMYQQLAQSLISAKSSLICGASPEHGIATLSCPTGKITEISFASYGTPNGSCGHLKYGSCNASSTASIVNARCLHQSGCSIQAENALFGDPCVNTFKRLYVQATCQ